MNVLLVMGIAVVVLAVGGRYYSRYIARQLGEDASRPTPAVERNDGRDYVPTPTPVVFAHHYASIAGAGPIIGPALAIIYGWVPALVWVLLGGVLIGAVHDYLATYMATREGGNSIATIARRMLGKDAFVAVTILLVVMLALVCAAFLDLSATALTSMLPFDRLDLPKDQTLFRVVEPKPEETSHPIGGTVTFHQRKVRVAKEIVDGQPLVVYTVDLDGQQVPVAKASILQTEVIDGQEVVTRKRPVTQVVVGGVASMSVICITAVAPLIGFLYLKRKVSVWLCSALAILICAASITAGLYFPVPLGPLQWKLLLSAYVLVAAGVPVWIFLQSRDFINVHILYVGMAALLVTLVVGGFRGAGVEAGSGIPPVNIGQGTDALGIFWPTMFIVIACGAVSGFHSLCAGGTTCKQLTSERAARQIGYYGMLLESFLAACVISVFMIGAIKMDYIRDVHPKSLLGLAENANPILGFAMAVGHAAHQAFGIPSAYGALAGMILLEGFLVTTLDTAIRLTRYLIEEIWRTFLDRYDVFAEPVAAKEPQQWRQGEPTPVGAAGIPAAPSVADAAPAGAAPIATSGAFRGLLQLLRQYWFNSGLAVALMLALALTGGQKALWKVFGTSNQLLAAIVLALAALWLLRKGKRAWFAFVPAALMLVTTGTNLVLLLVRLAAGGRKNATLIVADVVIMAITVYLLTAGARAAVAFLRRRPAGA